MRQTRVVFLSVSELVVFFCIRGADSFCDVSKASTHSRPTPGIPQHITQRLSKSSSWMPPLNPFTPSGVSRPDFITSEQNSAGFSFV